MVPPPLVYDYDEIRRAIVGTMYADDEPDNSIEFVQGQFTPPSDLWPIERECFEVLADGLPKVHPILTPQRVHKLRSRLAGRYRILNRDNLYRMEVVK